MLEKLDHDKFSGITEFIETDGDIAKVHSVQDVEPLIELNKARANEGICDQGIKDGMWHYCDIPMTILIEMKKKGINLFHPSPGDWKRFFNEVNTNYPYLKTTHKRHAIK